MVMTQLQLICIQVCGLWKVVNDDVWRMYGVWLASAGGVTSCLSLSCVKVKWISVSEALSTCSQGPVCHQKLIYIISLRWLRWWQFLKWWESVSSWSGWTDAVTIACECVTCRKWSGKVVLMLSIVTCCHIFDVPLARMCGAECTWYVWYLCSGIIVSFLRLLRM